MSAGNSVQEFETVSDFASAASQMEVGWSIRPGDGQFRAAIFQEPFADSLLGELQYYPCSGVRDADEIARSKADYVCLTFYEHGSMRLVQRGHTIEAQAGDFVVWDASSPSRFDCLAPTRCKLIWLPQQVFSRHVAGFECLENQIIPKDNPAAAVIGAHLSQLHGMLVTFPADKQARVFESSIEFMLSCLPERAFTSGMSRQQQALVERARRLVAERIGQDEITPAIVAHALGISVRYLHRLFALTGQSLQEYVTAQRLERARQALAAQTGKVSIAGIAQDAGFYDSSHFNKAFKRRYGVSPSRYRRA